MAGDEGEAGKQADVATAPLAAAQQLPQQLKDCNIGDGSAAGAYVLAVAGAQQPGAADDADGMGTDEEEARALRKVSHVVLPILFAVAVLAHLDKGNASFAALQLSSQLGITPKELGVALGLFYAGFGVAIVPSTFMTIKFGARQWMGVMCFAWGTISTCHALLRDVTGLKVLRFLLGAAEAAGTSSGGHLIAQFFPAHRLAMPFTVVVLSQVVSGIIAAPLAAGLMSLHGLAGLQGWQWLFIIEGIPSVLLGVAIWAWLPSHPLWDAWMLTPREQELLHRRVYVTRERADAARAPPPWRRLFVYCWQALLNVQLWFFIAVGVLWGLGWFGLFSWLPLIIYALISGQPPARMGTARAGGDGGAGGQLRNSTKAILLAAIPAVMGALAMVAVALHSDRVNEKALHVAVPYLVGGVLMACYAPMAAASTAAGFANLVLSYAAASAAMGVISSRVVVCLDTKATGIGLALYTFVIACFSGFAGPVIIGALVERMGGFAEAMVANGLLMIGAGCLMVGLAIWERGGFARLACRRGGRGAAATAADALAAQRKAAAAP